MSSPGNGRNLIRARIVQYQPGAGERLIRVNIILEISQKGNRNWEGAGIRVLFSCKLLHPFVAGGRSVV
jgi:hypothetical protein